MRRVVLALLPVLLACGGGDDGRAPESVLLVPALPADPEGQAAGLVDFGRVELGRNLAATVYLENAIDRTLVVEPPASVGPFSATVPPVGLAIPPHGSAGLELTFVPVVTGPAEELLALRAGEVAISLRLRGEGVAAGPCALSAAPLDFGEVTVPSETVQTAYVYAVGDGPCLVGEVALDGQGFALESGPTVGVTLRPGGAPLPIHVRFVPLAAGYYHGTLQIVAGEASVEVLLAGMATERGAAKARPPAGDR